MSPLLLLLALYVTALLGQSDLGVIGIVVTALGLAGLVVAVIAAILRPSWRLLSLLLPIAVPLAFFQIVCVWLIGDHHETITLSIYALSLVAALTLAAYIARKNPLAVAGAGLFALACAFIAFDASIFVFWNGLH